MLCIKFTLKSFQTFFSDKNSVIDKNVGRKIDCVQAETYLNEYWRKKICLFSSCRVYGKIR